MSRKIRSSEGGREWSERARQNQKSCQQWEKTENANQSTLDIPNEISLLVAAPSAAVAHSRFSDGRTDHLTDSATRWPAAWHWPSRALFLPSFKSANSRPCSFQSSSIGSTQTAAFIGSPRNPCHTLGDLRTRRQLRASQPASQPARATPPQNRGQNVIVMRR